MPEEGLEPADDDSGALWLYGTVYGGWGTGKGTCRSAGTVAATSLRNGNDVAIEFSQAVCEAGGASFDNDIGPRAASGSSATARRRRGRGAK